MRLIDADLLYTQLQKDEELARKRVLDTESFSPYPNNLNPSYTRYVTQMDERTRLKHIVADAPTIEHRKTGKWLVDPDGRLHCSRCLENPTNRVMIDGELVYDMTPIVGKMRFCPNCGAKMEGAGSEDIPMEYFESGGR